MRNTIYRRLALLHTIQDAQRHNFLQADVALVPNPLTKSLLVKLLHTGLILHYEPKPKYRHKGLPFLVPFTITLRYWEGQPLVALVATPGLMCRYQVLKKRLKQGEGSSMILWAAGGFLTSSQCLQKRLGGRICAVLS